jgi:hypothetical protein
VMGVVGPTNVNADEGDVRKRNARVEMSFSQTSQSPICGLQKFVFGFEDFAQVGQVLLVVGQRVRVHAHVNEGPTFVTFPRFVIDCSPISMRQFFKIKGSFNVST